LYNLDDFKISAQTDKFISPSHIITLLSAFRQVHNIFQSHFTTEFDLVLLLSIYSIPSFP
jgi:hypothetical protein